MKKTGSIYKFSKKKNRNEKKDVFCSKIEQVVSSNNHIGFKLIIKTFVGYFLIIYEVHSKMLKKKLIVLFF